jgi:hypothetical protein
MEQTAQDRSQIAVTCQNPADLPGFSVPFDPNDPLMKIPEGALLVWDGIRDVEVGVVVELGLGGLTFEYFDLGWVVADCGNIDLLTDAGLCISALPYRLLSDEPVVEEEPSPVQIRCARVCFGTLDRIKRTALETLLAIYGKRTV